MAVFAKDLVGNNVPNRLHRHAISPCPSNFVDPAEQFSSINSSGGEPIVESFTPTERLQDADELGKWRTAPGDR
jgi:hypothetical protein